MDAIYRGRYLPWTLFTVDAIYRGRFTLFTVDAIYRGALFTGTDKIISDNLTLLNRVNVVTDETGGTMSKLISESLWGESPVAMLEFVQTSGIATRRKIHLFSVACCRSVWHLFTDEPCRWCDGQGSLRGGPGGQVVGLEPRKKCLVCSGTGRINPGQHAVEVAERYADGCASDRELDLAWVESLEAARGNGPIVAASLVVIGGDPIERAYSILSYTRNEGGLSPQKQARILQCIIGRPPRPSSPHTWYTSLEEHFGGYSPTPDVLAIAQAAYVERPPQACTECVDGDVGCPVCEGAGIYYDPPFSLNRLKCQNCNDGLLPDKCKICQGTGRVSGSGILDSQRLAVLADALIDSGCPEVITEFTCNNSGTHRHAGRAGQTSHGLLHTGDPGKPHHHHDEKCSRITRDNELLQHLREPLHVRGCWVLDLLLGKT